MRWTKTTGTAAFTLTALATLLWGTVIARAVALLSAAAPPAGEYSCFKSAMEYSPVPGPGGPMLSIRYWPSVIGTLKLDGKATYRAFKGTGRFAYSPGTGRFSFLSGPLKGWPAVYEVSSGTPMVRLAALKNGSVGPKTKIGEHVCRWRGSAKFADTAAVKGVGRDAGAAKSVTGNPGFRGTLTFKEEWNSGAIVDVDLASGRVASRFEGADPHRAANGKTIFVNRQGALVIANRAGVTAATIPVAEKDGRPGQPVLSPDGEKIAYHVEPIYYDSRVIVVVRNSNKRVAEFKDVTTPDWTPDGRVVVARSLKTQGATSGILLSDAGLTKLTRIDPNLDDVRAPVVSPDNKRVAFVSHGHVWIMNLGSSGLKQVTFSDKAEERPAWSPKGDALVIATKEYGSVKLVRLSDNKMRDLNARSERAMQSSGRITWR